MHTFRRSAALALAALVSIAGCSGEDGKDGVNGTNGQDAPIAAGAGLKIDILSATAPASGNPTVTFKVTDAAGNPLDLSVDAFRPSWTIAMLNADGTYTSLFEADRAAAAYVDGSGATVTPVRTVTQAVTGTASTPAPGAADGEYTVTLSAGTGVRYTAATQTSTVTVAAYGSRTFEGTGYPAADSYSFVPAGGTAGVRQVVTDGACNACHKNLTAHGRRRTVAVCLTCHSPQTSDPESDNTVDMRVMIHKIHAGLAGYFIVGFQQSFVDYSKVVFPDILNGVKNCALCHGGAAQAIVPSIVACGSCHTTLATSSTHTGLTTCATGGCHTATSATAPNYTAAHSPLRDATTNLTLTGQTMDITIVSLDANTTAPTVTFDIKLNGAPAALTTSSLCKLPAGLTYESCGQLRFTIGGPTSDFGTGVLNNSGTNYGYLSSPNFADTRDLAPVETGTFFGKLVADGTVVGRYTAPLVVDFAAGHATISADTSLTKFQSVPVGTSIAVGVEAYTLEAVATTAGGCGTGTVTSAPTESATCAVREWAQSATAIKFVKVGGTEAGVARRTITSNAKCNACHEDLGFHGGESRKTPEYCAFCHHPNNVNDERITRLEYVLNASGAPTTVPYSATPNSVSIMSMAHKIHAGSALSNTYVLGADRSLSKTAPIADTVTFAGAFPGDLGDCQTCHAAGTYGLPDDANLGLLSVTYTCEDRATDTDEFCDTLVRWPATTSTATTDVFLVTAQSRTPPQTAACTSCHDSDAAKGHAELNTTAGGIETCAVCHGTGATYDVVQVHQPAP